MDLADRIARVRSGEIKDLRGCTGCRDKMLAKMKEQVAAQAGGPQELILRQTQSPGDIVCLTAALRDLHKAHPGRFKTLVESPCPELWEHNPYVREVGPDARVIECNYDLVHQSNQYARHFVTAFHAALESELGVEIPPTAPHGDIYLSDEERGWPNQISDQHDGPFWIINAGGKFDFTAKWWPPDFYQAVVDSFQGYIQFVQVGQIADDHWHPDLDGVIDLRGQTDLRQLVRLVYHAQGILCPVTLLMHLAAAVPTRDKLPRACVVVAGGREPPSWEAYPGHQYLHSVGMLDCCQDGGCWRSRCQLIGDGDPKDTEGTCAHPVQVSPQLRIPLCQTMIAPERVIAAIEQYMAQRPYLTPQPPMQLRPGTWDDAIYDEVFKRDHYGLMALKRRGLEPRRICDVGAHIGCWARLAGALWPGASIDCYEPDGANIERLRANLNGVCTLHPVAVGAQAGSLRFGPGVLEGRTVNTGAGRLADDGPVTVQVAAASEIVGDGLDLLKLDCEGAEAEILEALRADGLLGRVGVVVGEYHNRELGERCVGALAATHVVSHDTSEGLGRFEAWLRR